jgi:hypothetical protein
VQCSAAVFVFLERSCTVWTADRSSRPAEQVRALQSSRRAGDLVVQKHRAGLLEQQQQQQLAHRARLRELIPQLKPGFMASLKESQREEL